MATTKKGLGARNPTGEERKADDGAEVLERERQTIKEAADNRTLDEAGKAFKALPRRESKGTGSLTVDVQATQGGGGEKRGGPGGGVLLDLPQTVVAWVPLPVLHPVRPSSCCR